MIQGATNLAPPKVVILAGGFGTRLAERTDETPKPMVEIGGRPILWHILKIYGHFGFNDFIIACGYRGEMIKRFFLEYRERTSDLVIDFSNGQVERLSEIADPWRVALLDTGPETMTGGRVRRVRPHLGAGTFLMTYGDGVADVDLKGLVDFHRRHGKLATFTAVPSPSPFGHPSLDGDRVASFAEKPHENGSWINGGFFALETEVIDRIDGDHVSFEIDVLPELAREGQLMAYRHEGFWHAMDTLRDVRNLNRMWEEPVTPWKVWTA
jgi:glucose-1-phosphate cytidylyltransferase